MARICFVVAITSWLAILFLSGAVIAQPLDGPRVIDMTVYQYGADEWGVDDVGRLLGVRVNDVEPRSTFSIIQFLDPPSPSEPNTDSYTLSLWVDECWHYDSDAMMSIDVYSISEPWTIESLRSREYPVWSRAAGSKDFYDDSGYWAEWDVTADVEMMMEHETPVSFVINQWYSRSKMAYCNFSSSESDSPPRLGVHSPAELFVIALPRLLR